MADDNVIPLPLNPDAVAPESLEDTVQNLSVAMEGFAQGMAHMTRALVQFDARLKRIERMMGEGKRPPAILNIKGERAN